MRKQRNMSQIKEQKKTPEKELIKTETSNILDKEFKTLVIRMLNELRGKEDELSQNLNGQLENIKKNQSKIKNTTTEVKNTLQGINSRVHGAEDQICDLEDKKADNTQSKQKKERRIQKMRKV